MRWLEVDYASSIHVDGDNPAMIKKEYACTLDDFCIRWSDGKRYQMNKGFSEQ